MLYIIYGASGSGKTTFLNCVIKTYGQISVHRKGTTRKKRQYDDFEIESFPDGLPEDRFAPPNGYIYSSYGYLYGIEKSQINHALENNMPHFVICNDIETIKQIKNDYKGSAYAIYFQFDAPRERILEIQKRRNITDDEIDLRMSKIDYLEQQFTHNITLFDTSILNRYGANPEISLSIDLESLITRYEKKLSYRVPDRQILIDTINYLVDLTKEAEQKKDARDNIQIDKGFVFIIMPMLEQKKEKLWHTYSSIQTAAQQVGFRAEKIDRIPGNSSIDHKILENIKKAEIIIADLSYERPNCYYELGYARALGKDIIIISIKGTKIHFDADHYDRIEFSSTLDLSKELETCLLKRKQINNE